jgi:hypothetical protein
MFHLIDKTVLWMALLRLTSGTIEIIAGLLMLKFMDLNRALLINSSLALIGPVVLITTTTIGLIGLVDKVSYSKLLWVLVGVGFIFYGVRSK